MRELRNRACSHHSNTYGLRHGSVLRVAREAHSLNRSNRGAWIIGP